MLTKKQLDLLEFIHTRLQKDGVPPSFDEMKIALDLRSKSGIHRLITTLEERGFIRRLAHRARAIEILRLPDSISGGSTETGTDRSASADAGPAAANTDRAIGSAMDLPVMGRIAAGVPIEAISQMASKVTVPSSMLTSSGSHYALEVRGDSMIDAGINNGDIVVIRETDTADDGDIVVALVQGHEATLKKIYRRNGAIELEAANPAYETRAYPSDQVEVQGRLVGLIRSY